MSFADGFMMVWAGGMAILAFIAAYQTDDLSVRHRYRVEGLLAMLIMVAVSK